MVEVILAHPARMNGEVDILGGHQEMPEIIEAQMLVDGLQQVVGRTITKVEKLDTNNIINNEDEFKEFVEGSTITVVFRVGKRPCLVLNKGGENQDNPDMLGESRVVDIFLSMAGALMIDKEHKNSRVKFTLDNGQVIYYVDGRKWGRMTLRTSEQWEKKFKTSAVDALKASDEELAKRLLEVKDKDRSMKAILMDQGIIIGLGNVYAQEALHDAGIHPQRLLKDVSPTELDKLGTEIKVMLEESYKLGGLSMKDYLHVDGSLGEAFNITKVYRKKKCGTCGGRVDKIRQGGRSTYYCSKCQPMEVMTNA
ncbi:formamidopyrimidine-DNA glycosylase [Bacillus phage SP-15]|uniref:Formamidopyrimidine-DNA glycosylase n=1 Tax=Bacillus phage SP-15 TaxID=1792032 RepID=A0A127AWE5_9CAUD|nr:formamidopyrimidine-DNA glycosylase [Bacillus phage SP-15]AMM44965.1 formamidopyrimidine-DNA glycosylase [Bacillus phage SP-15]